MSEVKFSAEQLAEIQAKVSARIAEAKAAGNQDPMTEDTVRNLIDEEMKKYEEHNKALALEKERKEMADRIGRYSNGFAAGFSSFDNKASNPFSFRGKMAMTPSEMDVFVGSDRERAYIEEAQRMNNNLLILGKILGFKHKVGYEEALRRTKLFQVYRDRVHNDPEMQKAINITTTAEGLELVPTDLAGNIRQQIEINQVIPGLFQTIAMPTNPYKMPVETGEEDAFIVTETTADNPANSDRVQAQTPGSGNFTFSAVGLGSRVRISYEAEEDAIISLMPWIQGRMIRGLMKGMERAILNGDTSGTHQDSDTEAGAGNLPEKAWLGLRYYGLNNNGGTVDFSNGDPTLALMSSIMLLSPEYAAMPDRQAWILGTKGYVKIRVSDSLGVTTREKYGDGATILTGELAQWLGSPVFVSRYHREDVNASGVYDATTTNRGTILYVNRDGFLIGDRRSVLVEVDKDIETQQMMLVASERKHFKSPWDPTAAAYPFVAAGVSVKTT